MLNRRFPLSGLFAALLALMANLGVGAAVPRIDPIVGLGVLCHPEDSGSPSKTPYHPADCPVCPLCVAMHAPAATLVASVTAPLPPAVAVVVKTELPPPSTAPPASYRPPSQPRAPPTVS
jgi:hypothetical protein